jgi:F420-non-reducing hydrogenase small subunit
MPCTGCFGPTSRVRDQGAKMISSLASSIASSKPQAVDEALAGIPDPVGTFYRYGLAASLLRGGIDGMD